MQHKTDFNELMEGLLILARNPIALELQQVSIQKASLVELFKRYDGFKDGEFLALLSTVFGLNFSDGQATCYSGVGQALSSLLANMQSALSSSTNREALSSYLGVKQLPSARMFYWKYQLQKFSADQRILLEALINIDAIGHAKAQSVEEIGKAVAEAGASLRQDDLDILVARKIVDTYRDRYYIVENEAEALQSALATT